MTQQVTLTAPAWLVLVVALLAVANAILSALLARDDARRRREWEREMTEMEGEVAEQVRTAQTSPPGAGG